jgi:hypothetical protein
MGHAMFIPAVDTQLWRGAANGAGKISGFTGATVSQGPGGGAKYKVAASGLSRTAHVTGWLSAVSMKSFTSARIQTKERR